MNEKWAAVQRANEHKIAAERELHRVFAEALPLGSRLRVTRRGRRADEGAEYLVLGHGYMPGALTVCRTQNWMGGEKRGGPIAADMLVPYLLGDVVVVPQ